MTAVKGAVLAAGLPDLFAVVDIVGGRVLARGLSKCQATGFAKGWSRDNSEAATVPELAIWPTDDQVVALAQRVLQSV